MLKDILTFGEAAKLWGLDSSSLRKSIERKRFLEGEIRKSGNVWLVTREAMERLYGKRED